MRQNKWPAIIITIVIVAIITGGGVWLWQNKQVQQPTLDSNKIESADWKTYQNNELGIKLKYPESLGELSLQVYDTKLSGEFSNTPNALRIGGITKDYTAPRSGYYMDFSGFKKEDDKYFWEFVGDITYPIEPKVIISDNILLVDCMSFEDKCVATGPSVSVSPGQLGGLINLQKNNLPGLILIADKDIIDEDTFVKILSSFEFIK